jgi:hypothetical protein
MAGLDKPACVLVAALHSVMEDWYWADVFSQGLDMSEVPPQAWPDSAQKGFKPEHGAGFDLAEHCVSICRSQSLV